MQLRRIKRVVGQSAYYICLDPRGKYLNRFTDYPDAQGALLPWVKLPVRAHWYTCTEGLGISGRDRRVRRTFNLIGAGGGLSALRAYQRYRVPRP